MMKKLKIICIVSLLLSGATFAQKSNIFHNRDFWKTNPSIAVIDAKIAEGNDVTKLNSNAFDGVVYAILENTNTETIKYLLSKKGNDVNKKTHDGRTYLFWAAYKNNLELMKYVVSKGAKTTFVDTHGNTFLNFAAASGQTDLALYAYSFKIGASITHEKNYDGANALLLVASYLKNYQLIDLFLSEGAALTDTDSHGNGFFEYAAKGGNIPFLKTLIAKGIDTGKNAMIFASAGLRRKRNTLETYKFLESVGIKVNIVDKTGKNPLHAIAYNSTNLATYTYFISRGVAANLQDNEGITPFMNAANSNTLAVVTFLAKTLKDFDLKDKKGRSALAKAVQRNDVKVVNFLLEQGANIHTADATKNTLSYYLLTNFRKNSMPRFEAKLKVLEKNGLVLNTLQNSGNTLLHIATEKNNLALLKRLNSFNIDVNKQNEDGISALQIAAMQSKNIAILEYLIRIGANKNIKTAFDETIYDLASENEIFKQNNLDIDFLK
jgi:ankyrin repeat protein